MSDYNEHLISMAGGDGDVLAEIEARIDADRDEYATDQADQSIRDREALVALVKAQGATITAIRDLANARGQRGWHVSPSDIRATLGATA